MAKENQTAPEQAEVKKLNAAEWIEKHANLIMGVICGLIIVVGGIIIINEKVIKPKADNAAIDTISAYAYFEARDFEKALNGDGEDCKGFATIADEYNNQEGELAALYAGLCCYEMGNYEEAAEYMSDFSADDINIDPAVKMHVGDAFVEMGELNKAAKAFKAAAESKNDVIAPMALKKAGIVYLEQEDKAAAKKVFEQIKNDYPMSNEAQDIDKYIAVAE